MSAPFLDFPCPTTFLYPPLPIYKRAPVDEVLDAYKSPSLFYKQNTLSHMNSCRFHLYHPSRNKRGLLKGVFLAREGERDPCK